MVSILKFQILTITYFYVKNLAIDETVELSFISYCCHADHERKYSHAILCYPLTLKAPITTAADDIHKFFSLLFRENKT